MEDSSVTGTAEYLNFVQQAVNESDAFDNFRCNIAYTKAVECPNAVEGKEMIEYLFNNYPKWNEDAVIRDYLDTDCIGNPKKFEYEGLGVPVSPYTIQKIVEYMDMYSLCTTVFNKPNLRIAEIGPGYGSLFRILSKKVELKKYTMFDLATVLELIKKFLSCYNDIDMEVLDYYHAPPQPENICEYDFLISCNSFSELNPQLQQDYMQKVITKSKHGFIVHNPLGLEKFCSGQEVSDYLYDIPNCKFSPINWLGVERSSKRYWRRCCIIYW